MSFHQINKLFPSNHPFFTHISEKAMFPSPTKNDENPNDPLSARSSCQVEPYIVTHTSSGKKIKLKIFL